MTDIVLFIENHLGLFMGWIAAIFVTALYELYVVVTSAKVVAPQEATDLINRENAAVIDVRSQKDFSQGYIVGSVNFPADTIKNSLNKLEPYQNRVVILIGSDGVSSRKLANELLKLHALKDVRALTNGIQSWKEAGLPLEKK